MVAEINAPLLSMRARMRLARNCQEAVDEITRKMEQYAEVVETLHWWLKQAYEACPEGFEEEYRKNIDYLWDV
jgi:hypothetical protein